MVYIKEDECYGCGTCAGACPAGALLISGEKLKYTEDKCDQCRICINICPVRALSDKKI